MADQLPTTTTHNETRESTSQSSDQGNAVALSSGAEHLERLAQSFEISARRWELVVYPSLFAFIILAAYGFYLVYSLANDMAFMARSVDGNMTTMVGTLENVSHDMDQLTIAVDRMSNYVHRISGQIEVMDTMSLDMQEMRRSVGSMSHGIHFIRGDMAHMNQSIGRPLSFVNAFAPW